MAKTSGQPIRKARFFAKPGFGEAYRRFRQSCNGIREKITTFNRNKRAIPPVPLPAGMRDHMLKGRLQGIRECHVCDDALLLYTHENDVVRMIAIVSHDQLYRKEMPSM